jgi:hypothetical protein
MRFTRAPAYRVSFQLRTSNGISAAGASRC